VDALYSLDGVFIHQPDITVVKDYSATEDVELHLDCKADLVVSLKTPGILATLTDLSEKSVPLMLCAVREEDKDTTSFRIGSTLRGTGRVKGKATDGKKAFRSVLKARADVRGICTKPPVCRYQVIPAQSASIKTTILINTICTVYVPVIKHATKVVQERAFMCEWNGIYDAQVAIDSLKSKFVHQTLLELLPQTTGIPAEYSLLIILHILLPTKDCTYFTVRRVCADAGGAFVFIGRHPQTFG